MGEKVIRKPADDGEARSFTRSVLDDIRALEELIERGGIESGITRMGVEQEMYLVGDDGLPRPVAADILSAIDDPRFTTELARFNLEANFDPQEFTGSFLATLEDDLNRTLHDATSIAQRMGANVLLTGILPTLRQEDLGLENLTPELRYQYLNEALFQGRDAINVMIDGIESYEGTYDSVALEGANTSLQLHLQVTPEESGGLYNLMQLITAPLLAAATNSPVLLGHRLWHETRIAVFERSLDERSESQLARDFPTRVSFGKSWIDGSIIEIFRDNAARFPIILTRELDEESLEVVRQGAAPKLGALALHNGTVWRWNRPCYGVAGGVAHLRIENRVLPSGPTIIDEVANAALFYGMMAKLPETYGDVSTKMLFDDVRTNFFAAAREGLAADFDWLDGRRVNAKTLLLEELIPAAREGLAARSVPAEQIDRYLGIVEARVASGQTGSRWLLDTYDAQRDRRNGSIWHEAVAAMMSNQQENRPVHEWELPDHGSTAASATLGGLMTRDLFTVRPDDVIDLASSVMEWKHVRHIPVEDSDGKLVGVLTVRDLLNASAQGVDVVRDVMRSDFVTASPETSLKDGADKLLASDLGCLLIVHHDQLMGIVTERDLLSALAERTD